MNGKQPTAIVRDAVNELLARNSRTTGAQASERMYLGHDMLVVPLVRPVIIEGQWEDVETGGQSMETVDLFDLMDMHERETGR